MNIKNCRGCGRIFNYVSGPFLCQACREGLEAKFQEVKEYIREHPGVGMSEVAAACDVEISTIQQWLREERLEVSEDSPIYLSCESCGQPIRSGRFCENCKKDVTAGFKEMIDANKPKKREPVKQQKENPKMRFL